MTDSFGLDRVVVGPVGDVDIVTAPDFESVLSAVVDLAPATAVVDLARTDFMGVAGLRILETAARRLICGGRRPTIGPYHLVGWMLAVTGVADIVKRRAPRPAHAVGSAGAAGRVLCARQGAGSSRQAPAAG